MPMRVSEANSRLVENELCRPDNKVKVLEEPAIYFYYNESGPLFSYTDYSEAIRNQYIYFTDSNKIKLEYENGDDASDLYEINTEF